jgi:GNAT superfamily N-acetyltransferase
VSVTIEPYASADDLAPADLAAATAITNAAWAGWVDGERPMSEAAFADEQRHRHMPDVYHLALARDRDGRLVGLGELTWRDPEPEPGASAATILVAPDTRKAGVGTALARHLVRIARDAGRIGITFEAAVGTDADAACERAGLQADLVEELNRADPHAASDELLASWVTAGEAARGYSLVTFDDRCPDHLAEAFTAARFAMNDAPRFEGEPPVTYTVEYLRAFEAARAASHLTWWCVGVRHDATRAVVGLSDILLWRERPWIAFQGDTAVVPAHRGHRLGAWMKATNHLRLRRERPAVEVVSTWNASSNEPMLRINRALGFAPAQRFRAWYLRFE